MQNITKINRADLIDAILETTPDGFWMVDKTGHLVDANEAYCRMSGYQHDELVGMRIADIDADEKPAETEVRINRIIANGHETFEARHQRKDGSLFDVEVSTSYHDGDPPLFVCFCRDISERKRDVERIEKLLHEAQAATAAKNRFLADMSHEIRTPMNGVLGMIDMLMQEPLSETQNKYANIIRQSGSRLVALVSDILDLAKVEAGRLEIVNKAFDFYKFLDEVMIPFRLQAEKKGLSFEQECVSNVPATLFADSHRLSQILSNLIGNALKFTETGGIRITVKHLLIGEKQEIEVSIEDTGPGIPDEKLERLFEPFEQGHHSHGRELGGAGLGLSLSKRLAERMGGRLTLSSRAEGGGTIAHLALPIQTAGEKALPKVPSSTPARGHAETPPCRILVAEDDPVSAFLIKTLLTGQGHEVVIAEDGDEALSVLREQSFDLIFMDCQMPQRDGFATTAAIRQGAAGDGNVHIPIIALTAYAMVGDRERCLDAGMDDYVPKPIVLGAITEAMRRVMVP